MSYDYLIAAIMQGLAYSSLALGVFLSLRIFNIPDITTDGSFTLGSAVTAVMVTSGYNPLLALPVAIAAGMTAGSVTGIIHTKWNIHPLLAGILVMTALYSVNLKVMGRSNIPLGSDDIYSLFDVRTPALIFFTLATVVLLLVLILTWLLKTDFGIAMRATGNNETMVRAAGVNTNRMKVTGLAIANGLTALSGYLITQYQGFADINMGIGIVISGLGAAMIGEALLTQFLKKGIIYSILSVVAGSIVFRLVIAAALSTGVDPNYLKLITALIVLIIVAFSSRKFRLQ